jgi:vacuolar-type H+-ATPase subunit H
MSFLPILVIVLVFFIGGVIVLQMLFGRQVTHATAQLQALNAEYTRRQEELKERIKEAERQYDELMAKARTEAEQMVLHAKQEAESTKARTVEEARAESDRIIHMAMTSRDAIRKEIEQDMERRTIDRACEMIRAALPAVFRRQIQSHWLEELLADGRGTLDGLKTDEAVQEARIASAFPLSAEQRRLIQDHLKKLFGRDMTLTEVVDETLVAGLTLTVGSRVLDGTLASKIQHEARRAQQAI